MLSLAVTCKLCCCQDPVPLVYQPLAVGYLPAKHLTGAERCGATGRTRVIQPVDRVPSTRSVVWCTHHAARALVVCVLLLRLSVFGLGCLDRRQADPSGSRVCVCVCVVFGGRPAIIGHRSVRSPQYSVLGRLLPPDVSLFLVSAAAGTNTPTTPTVLSA